MIPEDILRHLSYFMDYKTLLSWYSTCNMLYQWGVRRPSILTASVLFSCNDIITRWKKTNPGNYWHNDVVSLVKELHARSVIPYSGKEFSLMKFHNNEILMNMVLNEQIKLWSPHTFSRNVTLSDSNKWIIKIVGAGEKISKMKRLIYHMVKLVKGKYTNAIVDIVGTGGPFPQDMLRLYADAYKMAMIGDKRKRVASKIHIPTKYWFKTNGKIHHKQSYHALQCMNLQNSTSVNALVTFKLTRDHSKTWKWYIRLTFSHINIYSY